MAKRPKGTPPQHTTARVRCEHCDSIIPRDKPPIGYLRYNGTPIEPQRFDFAVGRGVYHLFNEVHGSLIRLFFLFRQVEADQGREPTTKRFAKCILRNHLSLARALAGTLPPRYEKVYYKTRTAHQWCMLMSAWWKQTDGPEVWLQLGPQGEVIPVAQYPDGTYHEDPIEREIREREERTMDEPWGYTDSNEYYDNELRKLRDTVRRAVEHNKKKRAKGSPKKTTQPDSEPNPKTKTKRPNYGPFPPPSTKT